MDKSLDVTLARATRIVDLSATTLASVIRNRTLSAVEVLDAYTEHIGQANPRINGIVTLRLEEAREEAVRIDRRRTTGSNRPLLGVPFTVKDVIATAGVRTTCGSRLFEDYVPSTDATSVARLKAAGGILLGKTNCPEFALDPQTDNLLFGPTRNPLDFTRTPGGSSGGESAAIAARCSPLGLGTDFGGSLRFPAHCTGITALRPTAGRVPNTGSLPATPLRDPVVPNSLGFQGQLQVIGPLARRVSDLALALRVLAGPDNLDPLTMPIRLLEYQRVDVRTLRFAWCDGEGAYPVRSDVVAVVQAVARHLQQLGLSVTNRRPPLLETAEDLYSRIRGMDGLAEVRQIVAGRERQLTPWVQSLLETARDGTLRELLHLNAQRDRLRASFSQFMSEHDILLMPVAALPAFPLGTRSFVVEGRDLPYLQVGACCRSISLFGCPAAVVPCGTSREGLPVGVQIVAAPFQDHLVLAAAALLEREFLRTTCEDVPSPVGV